MKAHDNGRRTSRAAIALLSMALLAGLAGLAACDEGGAPTGPPATGGTGGGTQGGGTQGGGTGAQGGGPSTGAYLDSLIDVLRTGTRTERAEAATEIGELGDDAAVPALVDALRDESWDVRTAAATALGKLPDPAAVSPLLELIALDPAPPAVREDDLAAAREACDAAVTALGIIGDPDAVPRLVEIATDEGTGLDRDAAATAVEAIGEAGVPAVARALAGASPADAPAVAALLGRLGDPALDPLVAALKDKRAAVRVAAAEALGGLGPAAVKPLIAALGGKGSEIRVAAARSLGRIGDPRATDPLVRLLADSSTRGPAVSALVAIHRDDATPLVKYLRSRSTVQVYRPLIRIGQPDTVAALAKALKTFGTKTMGETYLNCGEPRLEKAAKAWAKAHGYIVVPSYGAGEEAWGTP